MRHLSQTDSAALQSRMSDDSVATLLGRSSAWVRRHRAATVAPPQEVATLPDDRRAAIIDRLEDEFDLLCLGRPSVWRIEQAILQAVAA